MARRLRALPFVLLVLAACATSAPHPPAIAELVGTWQLDAPVPTGARIPTLNVGGDGSISGNGGVNKFRGTLDVKALADHRWQAGSITGTRMAGPQQAMQLENEFLRALATASGAQLEGDRLRLMLGDRTLLSLARVRFR